jgi:hypothetical protein
MIFRPRANVMVEARRRIKPQRKGHLREFILSAIQPAGTEKNTAAAAYEANKPDE